MTSRLIAGRTARMRDDLFGDHQEFRPTHRLVALLMLLTLLGIAFAQAALADVDMKTCNVTATSSTCVATNGARQQLELRNVGASQPAYCSTICPATTSNSFVLPVSGANPWREIGNELAGAKICCITATSTTTVVWREQTRKGQLTAPTPTPIATPTPTP